MLHCAPIGHTQVGIPALVLPLAQLKHERLLRRLQPVVLGEPPGHYRKPAPHQLAAVLPIQVGIQVFVLLVAELKHEQLLDPLRQVVLVELQDH